MNEIGTKYGILNAVLSLANLFGIPIAASIIKDGTPKGIIILSSWLVAWLLLVHCFGILVE